MDPYDAREIRLDALDQAVDDVIVRLRNFSASILSDDSDDNASTGTGYTSDGWGDPASQSPSHNDWNGTNQSDTVMDERFQGGEMSYDPHPHASKKRKTISDTRPKVRSQSRRNKISGTVHAATSRGLEDSAQKSKRKRSYKEGKSDRDVASAEAYTDSGSGFKANHGAKDSSSSISICGDPVVIEKRSGSVASRSKAKRKSKRSGAIVAGHRLSVRTIKLKSGCARYIRKSQKISEASQTKADNDGDHNTSEDVESSPSCDETNESNIPAGKWLGSNSGDIFERDKERAEKRFSLKIRKERRSLHRTNNERTKTSFISPEVPSLENAEISRDWLFSSLYRQRANSTEHMRCIPTRNSNLQHLCNTLAVTNLKGTFKNVLNEICQRFANDGPHDSASAALVFQTMIDVLKNGGSRTLQDHVSNDNPALDKFVAVLVATLRLLRLNVNKRLQLSDKTIFDIFVLDGGAVFIDFVLMQLVDSAMSIFHPTAWDLRVKDRRQVLKKLEPLRNELAHHVEVVERVCHCLARDLGQQKWRCMRGGDNIFVSSIDPDLWCSFLSSATKPPQASTVRHLAFREKLPRCEIESIWCIVAYSAGAEAHLDCTDSKRWEFVSQLLTKGSLSASATSASLPPSIEQINAAVSDLTNFTDLIASGAMRSLPRRDGIIFDLLQRALSLHGDDVFLNEDSHGAFHSVVHNEKQDRNFELLISGRTLKATTSSTKRDDSVASVAKTLTAANAGTSWMGQPLLLPSSRILRCCLGLLVAWKGNIPFDKTNRLQYFDNVLKALTKNLIDEESGIENLRAAQSDRDVFGEAFPSCTCEGLAEIRRALFRSESAAYLTMFAYFSIVTTADQTSLRNLNGVRILRAPCEQIWSLLCDGDMRKRQEWIASNDLNHPDRTTYIGDKFRLYVTAKALSFLALFVLGASPWSSDPLAGLSGTLTLSDPTTLPFIFSCLLGCMDCACDSQQDPEIMSSIASCMAVVLMAVGRLISTQDAPLRNVERREHCSMTDALVRMLMGTNVLQRSFHIVTSALNCGIKEDLYLQVIVAVIRHAIALCPSEKPAVVQLPRYNLKPHDESEDFYGDIDEALLADIDLSADAKLCSTLENSFSSLFNLLADALLQSKPSSRNAVVHHDAVTDTTTMTTHGMKLVNKRSDFICCCLVEIAAVRWHPPNSIKTLWVIENRFSTSNDQGDTRYFKVLGQFLSRQLCNRHQSRNVGDIVRHGHEHILFNLLEVLLDTKLLCKVPSCSFVRIKANSGSSGKERGSAELVNYGKGLPQPLCDGMADVRDFCGDLGRILISIDNDEEVPLRALGQLLVKFNHGQNVRRPMKVAACLERECFDRFILLRNLVGFAKSNASNIVLDLERLSSLLLVSCCSELVRLLQKIGLQDQAHQDIHKDSYERAKLFETVSCYADLFVSVVAMVVCGLSTCCPSDKVINLLHHIYDRLIIPLLSGQNLHLIGVLHNTAALFSTALAGDKSSSIERGETIRPSYFDLKPYCNILRHCMIRRSKEFILSIAMLFDSNISSKWSEKLSSFLTVRLNSTERDVSSIGRSFSLRAYAHTASAPDGELAQAIDHEFACMEESEPLSVEHIQSLISLKRHALQRILVPKLVNDKSNPTTRIWVLRLIKSMLNLEHEDTMITETLDAMFLCCLAKGIGASVLVALVAASAVNEELIMTSFACARSLINLPAACVDSQAVGWLLDWACSSLSKCADADNAPEPTSHNVLHAEYLWLVCIWLKDLGNTILDENGADLVHSLREQLSSEEYKAPDGGARKIAWPPIGKTKDKWTVSDRLMKVETRIFPVSHLESKIKITNVYAARNNAQSAAWSKGPLEKWMPSMSVRSAVGRFNSKVRYASPLTTLSTD